MDYDENIVLSEAWVANPGGAAAIQNALQQIEHFDKNGNEIPEEELLEKEREKELEFLPEYPRNAGRFERLQPVDQEAHDLVNGGLQDTTNEEAEWGNIVLQEGETVITTIKVHTKM